MNAIKKKTIQISEAFFSNEKFEQFVLSSSIFKVKPRLNVELDVEDGKEMRLNFLMHANGKKWAILMDASDFFSTSKELRELMASKEYTDLRFALAIATKSMATKILGNFFIKVNKPASPTKLFAEEDATLKWLNHSSLSLQ